MKKVIVFLLLILVFIIYKIAFEYNPDADIENLPLDVVVKTPEQAIAIAEKYTLEWDKRAKANCLFIHYTNKQDLLDQTPKFIVYGGWMEGSIGFTQVIIHKNMLLKLHASEAHNNASMGTEFPEDMIFPSTENVIDILDLANINSINWREMDDLFLSVTPGYSNVWDFQLGYRDVYYYFSYNVSTRELKID
jgi:hypothetical protein